MGSVRLSLELTAERRQFAFQSLPDIHQRSLKAAAHLICSRFGNGFARPILQDSQQRQNGCQPKHHPIPPKIL